MLEQGRTPDLMDIECSSKYREPGVNGGTSLLSYDFGGLWMALSGGSVRFFHDRHSASISSILSWRHHGDTLLVKGLSQRRRSLFLFAGLLVLV